METGLFLPLSPLKKSIVKASSELNPEDKTRIPNHNHSEKAISICYLNLKTITAS